MNICCGETLDGLDLRKKGFDTIDLKLDKTILQFYEKEGVFQVLDTDDKNGKIWEKKNELKELKIKLEKKNKEIDDYLIKINDLDKKIKNMEKIILMDEKENQYIEQLGQNN